MGTTGKNQGRAGNSLPNLAIVLVIVTVIAYLPVLRGGFVFDDSTLITGNRMVKASDGLRRFWFTTEAPDYRFIRHPSYTGALMQFFGLGLGIGNWVSVGIIIVPIFSVLLWRMEIEEAALLEEPPETKNKCQKVANWMPFFAVSCHFLPHRCEKPMRSEGLNLLIYRAFYKI